MLILNSHFNIMKTIKFEGDFYLKYLNKKEILNLIPNFNKLNIFKEILKLNPKQLFLCKDGSVLRHLIFFKNMFKYSVFNNMQLLPNCKCMPQELNINYNDILKSNLLTTTIKDDKNIILFNNKKLLVDEEEYLNFKNIKSTDLIYDLENCINGKIYDIDDGIIYSTKYKFNVNDIIKDFYEYNRKFNK